MWVHSKQTGTPTDKSRGHAAINTKEDAVIIDDSSQGVALYKLSGTEWVKTFSVPSAKRRPRNVAFHDSGSAILSGSDHGKVYVFDRRTGDVQDIIYIGIKDWVQSITVCSLAMIYIWRVLIIIIDRWCRQHPLNLDWPIWRKHASDMCSGMGKGKHT